MLAVARESEPLLVETRNRFVLHPVEHTDVYAMAEQAEAAFWTTGEVDLSKDVEDWKKLSKPQQLFIEQVLAFFAASDGIVMENLAMRFMREVCMPEARYFYGIQMGIETIHSKMYSLLIDTYVQDHARRIELFEAIQRNPTIERKAQWTLQHMSSDAPFGERLLAFACVEGIFFSSSFAAIYYIKTLGLLPGLTQSNELIARDEGLHTEFAVLLYTRHLRNRLSTSDAHAMVAAAVDAEMFFVEHSLPVAFLGMNASLMQQYVKYVGDRLLLSLGYPVLYQAQCPFDFMMNIGTETKTNFFERRVSEYKRANIRQTDVSSDFSRSDDF
jgi:ribonucleoside-diphosphate reductase beta chain